MGDEIMFSAQVISSSATLNSFDVIGSLPFVPGTQTTFFIRLYQDQRADMLRYVPPSTALLSAIFQNNDATETTVAMTSVMLDTSMWSCSLTSAQTKCLASGNVVLSMDVLGDGTDIQLGFIQNALNLIITGLC